MVRKNISQYKLNKKKNREIRIKNKSPEMIFYKACKAAQKAASLPICFFSGGRYK